MNFETKAQRFFKRKVKVNQNLYRNENARRNPIDREIHNLSHIQWIELNVRSKKKRKNKRQTRERQQQRKSRKSIEPRKWPASLAPNSLFGHATYIIRSLSPFREDRSRLDENRSKFCREWSFPAKGKTRRGNVAAWKGTTHAFNRREREKKERKGFHSAAPILQPPPFGRRLPSTVHLTRALSGTRTVHCRIESSASRAWNIQGWPMVSGHYCWTGACAI